MRASTAAGGRQDRHRSLQRNHNCLMTQGHTAPNLNSLAVEIAAKVQSGTKQFDIRLDPPELGRVRRTPFNRRDRQSASCIYRPTDLKLLSCCRMTLPL